MKKVLFVFVIAVIAGASLMSFSAILKLSTKNDVEVAVEEEIPGWLAGLLNGFHVSWIRGWYSMEAGRCVERGMCEFNAGFGGGIANNVGDLFKKTFTQETRYALFDASGNMFILVFNPTSEDFQGASFYQDGDMKVPADLARLGGKSVYTIKKGVYPIERDQNGKWVAVRFLK